MTPTEFEALLDKTVEILGADVRSSNKHHNPNEFEKLTLRTLKAVAEKAAISIDPTFHPHAFPDIRANGFGVEVKSTSKDSWLSVGNSVFEGMRDGNVKRIYVVFGKMGGMPSVKWGRYEERITHVRISHAPRFVLEMDRDSCLFDHMSVNYDEFSQLGAEAKMGHIREYARKRLENDKGKRLWWLEDASSNQGLPLEVKLYTRLPKAEKLKLRAEAALLLPQICRGGRDQDKYFDVAFFCLKHRSVLCHQTRDMFSAGSVAGKDRGGNYVLRALTNCRDAMIEAARDMDDELFEEYWGEVVPRDQRIFRWLALADACAKNWRPSKHLFLELQAGRTE